MCLCFSHGSSQTSTETHFINRDSPIWRLVMQELPSFLKEGCTEDHRLMGICWNILAKSTKQVSLSLAFKLFSLPSFLQTCGQGSQIQRQSSQCLPWRLCEGDNTVRKLWHQVAYAMTKEGIGWWTSPLTNFLMTLKYALAFFFLLC